MKHIITALTVLIVAPACGFAYGQDQPAIPEDVKKAMDYLTGQWTYEGTEGNVARKGQLNVRWGRGGHCQIYSIATWEAGKRDELVHASVICGYDSLKKQAVETAFWSNGGFGTSRYEFSSPVVIDKGAIEGEQVAVIEGKEVKGKIRGERKGPNEFTWELTRADGDDIKLRFVRAEKPEGSKKKKKKPRQ